MKKSKLTATGPTIDVTPDALPEQIAPQIIVRPVTECARCHARDSFKQDTGPRMRGQIVQSYATCRECGYRAHIRYV